MGGLSVAPSKIHLKKKKKKSNNRHSATTNIYQKKAGKKFRKNKKINLKKKSALLVRLIVNIMEEIEKKICQTQSTLPFTRFTYCNERKIEKNQITTTHTDGHSASVIPSQAAVL